MTYDPCDPGNWRDGNDAIGDYKEQKMELTTEFAKLVGYDVHRRHTHVGFAYDFTWPGKTGMQNNMFKSENAAWDAALECLDEELLRAAQLLEAAGAHYGKAGSYTAPECPNWPCCPCENKEDCVNKQS